MLLIEVHCVYRYKILLPKSQFHSLREGTTRIFEKFLPQHLTSEIKMGKTKVGNENNL